MSGPRVVPFEPRHAEGIGRLISSIQREEFGLAITLADQPDLADIDGFYLRGLDGSDGSGGHGGHGGSGCFLVAEEEGGAVVGTVALRNIGQGRGALRKMFVARERRGGGLAAALLQALVAWCAENGVAELVLGTTERFLAAHRFYEKHGFERIAAEELPPGFPRMAVDSVFYRRVL